MLLWVRSILLGWITLFALTFLVERPLLRAISLLLGASWLPTAQLALACATLAAIGWIIGRWGTPPVLGFALTLAIWNFRLIPAMNIPWLFRLLLDSFENSRYFESLLNSLIVHGFLFGSLFIGAHLNRPRDRPVLHIK